MKAIVILFVILLGRESNLCTQDSTAIFADTTPQRKIDSVQQQIVPSSEQLYKQPKPFGFITNVPDDIWELTKSPFRKKSFPTLALLEGSTALMIHYDQSITDGVKNFSVRNNIDTNTRYTIFFRAGSLRMRIPTNLTSVLYVMGEGWVGLAIGGGIWISGKMNNNQRDKQTANDLVEGFISSGLMAQVIKRSTGRESPFVATIPGGKGQPFPSFRAYQRNTPQFDAFPSGHLSTMMAYTTILADNYPEKKSGRWVIF